jgi:hypothetical protein
MNRLHGVSKQRERLPVIEQDPSQDAANNATFVMQVKDANFPAKPIHIAISKDAEEPHIAFAHEFGHYLEKFQINGHADGARDWSKPGVFTRFQRAVEKSIAYQQLKHKATRSDGYNDREFSEYHLRWEEIWARAYSQYIVERSGDDAMKKELAIRRDPKKQFGYDCNQWSTKDFAPIAAEIDRILKKQGWKK